VSHRYAVGDEGAEVENGNRDIRLEAGEWPEGAYFVSDKGSVHGPAWPRGEPRSALM
jgi:hypothetical protein